MDLHLLVFVVAICTVFFGCNAKTSMEDCNPTFEVTANSVIYFAEGGGALSRFSTDGTALGFQITTHRSIESISASGDEGLIAISIAPKDPQSEHIVRTYTVSSYEPLDLTSTVEFPVRFPVMSIDGALLVYGRPTRLTEANRVSTEPRKKRNFSRTDSPFGMWRCRCLVQRNRFTFSERQSLD